MEKTNAISVNLTNGSPSASLMSYYYARMFIRSGWASWVQLREGMIPGTDDSLSLIPPSGVTTERIFYVGDPLDGLDFARKSQEIGLGVVLFPLGLRENTLPVSPRLLERVEAVIAPPQTAGWLRINGCKNVVDIGLPFYFDEAKPSSPDGPEMEVVFIDRTPINRLPFRNKSRRVSTAENGEYATPKMIRSELSAADVVVSEDVILDDPIRIIGESVGVPVVSPELAETLPSRLVEAAQDRRAGKVMSPAHSAMPLDVMDRIAEGGWSGFAYEVRGDDVQLGVVIPFGGSATEEELEKALEAVQESISDDQVSFVVVGHLAKDDLEMSNIREIVEEGFGVTYAGRTDGESGWSISKARNTGFKEMADDVTHVMFLDLDVRPDVRFFRELREAASRYPGTVLAPYVQNDSGNVRIGSGVATYPVEALRASGGFDETFIGWGPEDIEHISRLRDQHMVPSVVVGDPISPALRHIDHDKR